MAIFFKHLFWPDVGRWGSIGLPSNQGKRWLAANIKSDDRIVLALTQQNQCNAWAKFYAERVFGMDTMENAILRMKKLA